MKPRALISGGIAVVALVALMILFFMWEPGKSGPGSTRSKERAAAGGQTAGLAGKGYDPVELTPFASRLEPLISDVVTSPTGLRFNYQLTTEGGKSPRVERPPVALLPAGQEVQARLVAWSVDPPAKESADAPAPAPNVKDAVYVKPGGVMRRWTLGTVALKPEFLNETLKRPAGQRLAWKLTVELTWPEAVDPARAAPFPAEADPKSPWGSVAAAMVVNQGDLGRFQLSDPPPATDVAPKITAPWAKLPGDQPWARLRVTREGIYQLNLDDLIGAGFSPSLVKAADARLFSRGEPVPLLRVGQGAAQKIYFWAPAPDSETSPERIFWVTMAADAPDPFLPEFKPDAGAEGAGGDPRIERIATTRRVAARGDENRLKIETGNFLAIKAMQWVDTPLRLGGALPVPLEIKALAPAVTPAPAAESATGLGDLIARARPTRDQTEEGDVHGELWIYPEGGASAPVRGKIDLTLGGATLASAIVKSGADQEHPFSFSSRKLAEGKNALELRLDHPPDVAINDRGTTIWLASLRLDYPSRPELVEGRLDLLAPDATTTRTLAWTPISGAAAPFQSAVAVAVDPRGRATGWLRPSRRGAETGYLWPLGTSAERARVVIASPEVIPATRSAERIEIDPLIDAGSGADYVIITHKQFRKTIEPLAQRHTQRGLKVRVIDVQSIYDTFSDGELSPIAIRDFFAYTLKNWKGGAPSYALLVGDTTSDYLNRTKSGLKNWVPTYSYDNGYEDFASDHWLTVLAGADDLSDIMLGRLSANSVEDCEALVAKTLKYEADKTPGPWRSRVTLVADDGGFADSAEELRRDWTPPGLAPERIYMDDEALLEDNWYLPQQFVAERKLKVSPMMTWQIRRAFERGCGMMLYYGHGSPNIWMDERVWFGGDSINSDNQHLAGSGRMSFVSTMTCNTGAIDYPVPKGLPGVSGGGWNINISEDMMRVPEGGAIAMFVPSGPEGTSTQQIMARELYAGMFHNGLRRFGVATTLAKNRYTLNGGPKNLLYMFILLGDPAVENAIAPPGMELQIKNYYAPGDTIAFSLQREDLKNARAMASVEMITDGRVIWSDENLKLDRQGLTEIKLPDDCPSGDARLSLYAWDEKSGAEFAAGANFNIAYPAPRISVAALRPSGDADGQYHLLVTLADESPGIKESARVEAVQIDGPTSPRLIGSKREDFWDKDGESRAWVDFPKITTAPTGDKPLVFEVKLAKPPPSPEGRPWRDGVRRVALPPSSEWTGLVPELSSWRRTEQGRRVEVDLAGFVGLADTGRAWSLGIESANLPAKTQESEPVAPGRESVINPVTASLALDVRHEDDLSTATVWLAPEGVNHTADDPLVRRLPLKDLHRRRPSLRIVPDSIKVEPEAPFEGQTILVRFEVENTGDAPAGAFSAALLERPPAEGGQPAEDHLNGLSRRTITGLREGERRGVLLRQDPVGNFGERKLYIWVDPYMDIEAGPEADRLHEVAFKVRTKASLAKGLTTIKLIQGRPKDQPAFTLTGPVINEGETDAYNVLVTFYRSEIKTPENELGSQLLEVIPGGETRTAEIIWEPKTEELARGIKTPEPQHQLRLNWRREFTPRKRN